MDPIWDTYNIYKSNGQISVVSSSFRHRSHVTLEATVKLKGYVLDTQERWEAGCHGWSTNPPKK